jgi:hypothetical protein
MPEADKYFLNKVTVQQHPKENGFNSWVGAIHRVGDRTKMAGTRAAQLIKAPVMFSPGL